MTVGNADYTSTPENFKARPFSMLSYTHDFEAHASQEQFQDSNGRLWFTGCHCMANSVLLKYHHLSTNSRAVWWK